VSERKLSRTQRRVKFIQDISALILIAEKIGIKVMPFCYHRTQKQQEILRKRGVSWVKRSKHQDWLAMDLVVLENGRPIWTQDFKYRVLGYIWEEMGHTWGGSWKKTDVFHFEYGKE